jgi:bifunctional enzyme CysN/CysC
MLWYDGPALLEYLEQVDVSQLDREQSFILPIQRVCRPDHRFRGFQGQILSGEITVGQQITVRPSGEQARVIAILEGDRRVQHSAEGHPVTLQLDSEIDVSRGCVLEAGNSLTLGSMFTATLLWMDDLPLTEGKSYWLKLGTQQMPATVMRIRYRVDINSGTEVHAENVYKNEIAFCEVVTGNKIVFTPFAKSRDLGALILIDRVSNQTAACGVITQGMDRENNLFWQETDVTRALREQHMGQCAATIWLTGLSGSGKSTIANELEKRLFAMGKYTMLLDGDNVRMGLNKNLGFTQQDRIENIRRIAEVSKLMNDAGLIVITSFISPFRQDRHRAGEIIGDGFVEVYINTPLEECERRDAKGLYKAARAGKIPNFTGITSPYEEPESPHLVVETVGRTVEECAEQIIQYLKNNREETL